MACKPYENIDYPSKVLLFGEYTVLDGSKALAIPYSLLSGRWSLCDEQEILFTNIHSHILTNCSVQYLPIFNGDQFLGDINNGLCFDSDIPSGYGIGSSGSLTAAIFDRYFKHENLEIRSKMQIMAMIECFFHGNSSGLDPLISLMNASVLVDNKKISFPKLEMGKALDSVFLFNSGISRSTQDYVTIFFRLKEDDVFIERYNELTTLNESIINTVLGKGDIKSLFKEISKIQVEIFRKMIPDHVLKLWEEGLATDSHYFKLCGAGGGGFFLVYNNGKNESSEWTLLPLG